MVFPIFSANAKMTSLQQEIQKDNRLALEIHAKGKYHVCCGRTGRITAREARGYRKVLPQSCLPANGHGTDIQDRSKILTLQTWEDVKETANDMIPQIGNNTAEFSSFINNNYIYVDKTKSIYELLTDHRRHLFLSRPRRFGKTLLIDTLEEVLTGRKELFSGLTIHNLWKDSEWPQSHVFRISLNSFTDNPSTLDESLTLFMHSFAKDRGIEPIGNNCADSLIHTFKNLFKNYKNIPITTDHISVDENIIAKTQKINILIDEYDAPIINNFTNATKRD
ncbi:MAG: AAA family ATPase, partial [Deltaproteobacteria bacterium]|nr:AAA family ATPase [Deltaproteobacteria bacterium]